MPQKRTYRAGGSVEDHCRACKTDRMHTVITADGDGRPIRVACGFCHSEHNFRGGPRVATSDAPPAVASGPCVRAATLVLSPGGEGAQDKSWPIETFFHKIVMVRNRLRTLEQQVNASDLPDDVKVKLQSYVSGCYGPLTSFNVLFADDADHFRASRGQDK